jgi:hypothetical protein
MGRAFFFTNATARDILVLTLVRAIVSDQDLALADIERTVL